MNLSRCPSCGTKSIVVSSRDSIKYDGLLRRRRCPKCEWRWSTVEVTAEASFDVRLKQKEPHS